MPHTSALLGFALVCLGMVLTPGPNMMYLISRSITQGPAAGIVSLGGVALGFVFYMLYAAFGITALLFAIPYAYDALRFAGAAYLLWLAWQAVRPGGRSPFQVKAMKVDVLLGPHPEVYDMQAKRAEMKDGAPNPFVKPGENATYVAGLEQDFDKQLAKQTAALQKDN